jgi:hypothetical protein
MANSLRPDSAQVVLQLQAAQIRCAISTFAHGLGPPSPQQASSCCNCPAASAAHGLWCDVPRLACRCAMVTGDHVRTAISVAHQCSILPASRPICLIDGVDGSSSSGEAGLQISLLHTDGTVEGDAAQAAVLPRVLLGELEVAVTGKGFSRMLDCSEPGLMQVSARRGAPRELLQRRVARSSAAARATRCKCQLTPQHLPGCPPARRRPCSAAPCLRACRPTTRPTWCACWAEAWRRARAAPTWACASASAATAPTTAARSRPRT